MVPIDHYPPKLEVMVMVEDITTSTRNNLMETNIVAAHHPLNDIHLRMVIDRRYIAFCPVAPLLILPFTKSDPGILLVVWLQEAEMRRAATTGIPDGIETVPEPAVTIGVDACNRPVQDLAATTEIETAKGTDHLDMVVEVEVKVRVEIDHPFSEVLQAEK